jgi:hypothetical protein
VDEVSGGEGYLSASDRALVIGLGSASQLDQADVRWRDGSTSQAKGLVPGRYEWVEGESPRKIDQ